jgi:hypothetical protein
MSDVRFRPCTIAEIGNGLSLLNEPAVDIPLRRQLPLHAVLSDGTRPHGGLGATAGGRSVL